MASHYRYNRTTGTETYQSPLAGFTVNEDSVVIAVYYSRRTFSIPRGNPKAGKMVRAMAEVICHETELSVTIDHHAEIQTAAFRGRRKKTGIIEPPALTEKTLQVAAQVNTIHGHNKGFQVETDALGFKLFLPVKRKDMPELVERLADAWSARKPVQITYLKSGEILTAEPTET